MQKILFYQISGGNWMTFYYGQKWPNRKRPKHRRAQGRVKTVSEQREALARIKKHVALKGYKIYPVAKWFRRSHQDFVAALGGRSVELFIVRPGHRHTIEILSYGKFPDRLKDDLLQHESELGKLVWSAKPLPAQDLQKDWLFFIPRVYWRAFALLDHV